MGSKFVARTNLICIGFFFINKVFVRSSHFYFITMTKFLFLIFELIQQNIQIFLYSRITFIADERFQAYFKDTTKEWILQIKYVQARDAGIYECQVSTEPKVSARAQLHVVGKE